MKTVAFNRLKKGRGDVRREKAMDELAWREDARLRLIATNKALMKARKMNKGELAKLLGNYDSQSTISNWESARNSNMPGGYEMYLYDFHFRVPPEWLAAGEPGRLERNLYKELESILGKL